MKRITVLRRKLRKKLTVKTLSFIMAAGLLLLIVPFVAIAAGNESPQSGSGGEFRLFNGLYTATQITLSEDQEVFPTITADAGDAVSYKWQAYSAQSGQYVGIASGKSLKITLSLAKTYSNGSKSSFRCVATDAEGNQRISDVLTVIVTAADDGASESSPEDETLSTIETISLTEPTTAPQEDETDPTEPAGETTEDTTAEGTTTEAASEPTEADTEPTGATTAPQGTTTKKDSPTTAPATQPTEKVTSEDEPADGENDPIEGKLLDPLTDEDDSAPIRAMLLAPETRAVQRTMTFVIEGSNSYTVSQNAGESISVDAPYRSGHTFTGWTVSSPGELSADDKTALETQANNGNLTVPDYDVTFTATWSSSGTTSSSASYTIEYWLDDPDTGSYPSTPYQTVVVSGQTPGTVYTLTDAQQAFSDSALASYVTRESGSAGPKTIKGNSTTVYKLYFKRKTYTLHFDIPGIIDGSSATWSTAPEMTKNSGTYTSTYTITARYGQSVNALWPEYSDFNSPVSGGTTYQFGGIQLTNGTIICDNPRKLTSSIVNSSSQEYTFHVNWRTGLVAYQYRIRLDNDLSNEYFTVYVPSGHFVSDFLDTHSYPEIEGYTYQRATYRNGKFDLYYTSTKYQVIYENTSLSPTTGKKVGDTITKPRRNPFKLGGYTFAGWYADPELSIPMDWSITMPAHDLHVYARFTKNGKTYYSVTVYSYEGGDVLGTISVQSGETAPTTDAIRSYTREGYDFKGWYTLNGTTHVPFVFNHTQVSSNLTVYGDWQEPVTSYNLIINEQNGTAERTVPVPADTPLTQVKPSDPTNGDKTFDGWYTDAACSDGNEVTWSGNMTSDLQIYAKWVYNLTINEQNGTAERTVRVAVDTPLTQVKPSDPTNGDKTFDGWYTDAACSDGNEVTWSGNMTGDLHIYAKWVYSLTIHEANKAEPTTVKVVCNSPLNDAKPADPANTDIRFEGWYTDEACSDGNEVTWSGNMTSDLHIYAKLICDLIIYEQNGNDPTTVSVPYNTPLDSVKPADPTYEGYDFDQWFKNAACTAGNEVEWGDNLTAHMNIYAKWDIIVCTVSIYQTKDAAEPSYTNYWNYGQVIPGGFYQKPTGPDGYKFMGWKYETEDGDLPFVMGETQIKQRVMKIYADWAKKEINIRIVNNSANTNVYTVSGGRAPLRVVVAGGGSVTLKHVPFGSYTVTSTGWDYRSVYSLEGASITTVDDNDDATEDTEPNATFTVTGTGVSRSLNWLGLEASEKKSLTQYSGS